MSLESEILEQELSIIDLSAGLKCEFPLPYDKEIEISLLCGRVWGDRVAKSFDVVDVSTLLPAWEATALSICADKQRDWKDWFKENANRLGKAKDMNGIEWAWPDEILYDLYMCWNMMAWSTEQHEFHYVPEVIDVLRGCQVESERNFFNSLEEGQDKRYFAFRLASAYHLARATELLAMREGGMLETWNEYNASAQQIDKHFMMAITSCPDVPIENALRYLYLAGIYIVHA